MGESSPDPPRKIAVADILAAAFSFLSGVSGTVIVWLLAFSLTAMEDLLSYDLPKTAKLGLLFAISALANLALQVAGYRTFLGSRNGIWGLDKDFWRYAGTVVVIGFVTVLILAVAVLMSSSFIFQWATFSSPVQIGMILFASAIMVLMALFLLKISLWPMAKAIGDDVVNFDVAWERMSGATVSLFAVGLLTGAPFAGLIFLLGHWIESSPFDGLQHYLLIGLHSIVSAAAFVVGLTISSAVYSLTAKRPTSRR